MPKFMTYQRPAPVNKANWTGKPGGNPYPAPPAVRPALPKPGVTPPPAPQRPKG